MAPYKTYKSVIEDMDINGQVSITNVEAPAMPAWSEDSIYVTPRITVIAFKGVEDEVLTHITENLTKAFSAKLSIIRAPRDALRDCLNITRGQLNASRVLRLVAGLRDLSGEGGIALGLVPGDAYVEGLNFVFGLASQHQATAVVFLERLKDRYGLPKGMSGYVDTDTYLERVLKEVMHELGHVFGLDHCTNKRCVMAFSNSIMDTDRKEWKYCQACAEGLSSSGIRISEDYVLES